MVDGFFHADLHQGNLFALPDGRIAAIDFGIMGRIDRRARMWLAEILYGLITGNYRRVAEIHFEAQYVPPHHNVDEFATALRAVGEPIRGLPVKDISVGRMLDGLFSITRDFDMPTQPHLLLLQKTMVMEEGVATALDPDINMWETAEPFLREWLRGELGPEAYYADRIVELVRAAKLIPDLIRRIDHYYPPPGAAPPPAPAARNRRHRTTVTGWVYGASCRCWPRQPRAAAHAPRRLADFFCRANQAFNASDFVNAPAGRCQCAPSTLTSHGTAASSAAVDPTWAQRPDSKRISPQEKEACNGWKLWRRQQSRPMARGGARALELAIRRPGHERT